MSFLNPIYLWGLLGLAVPLAIHLWSKKEGKTIKIGSIQLLTATHPKRASSIQVNEYFLLFLRLLMLTLLVLILASPQWKCEAEKQGLIYLIEPSLLNDAAIHTMLDSLPEESTRLLLPEFPKWDRDGTVEKTAEIPKYWQLAREMDNLQADSLVVFTRALFNGIQGKRPAVNSTINWVTLNPESITEQPVLTSKQGDSILLISVNSDSNTLKFDKKRIGQKDENIVLKNDSASLLRNGKEFTVPLKINDTLQVQFVAEETMKAEKRYLSASVRALASYIEQPIEILDISETIDSKTNVLFWLKNEPFSGFSGRFLAYKPDFYAEKLIVPTKSPNGFNLSERLNSENSISEKLTEQLLPLLKQNSAFKEEIAAYDLRSISKKQLKHAKNRQKRVKNRQIWSIFPLGFGWRSY